MKSYTTDYMRRYADLCGEALRLEVEVSKGEQLGMDWVYQLTIDGGLVTFPGSTDPAARTGWAPSEAIVGFLFGLIWLGPEVAHDIIAEGYDHLIDHPLPVDEDDEDDA